MKTIKIVCITASMLVIGLGHAKCQYSNPATPGQYNTPNNPTPTTVPGTPATPTTTTLPAAPVVPVPAPVYQYNYGSTSTGTSPTNTNATSGLYVNPTSTSMPYNNTNTVPNNNAIPPGNMPNNGSGTTTPPAGNP